MCIQPVKGMIQASPQIQEEDKEEDLEPLEPGSIWMQL